MVKALDEGRAVAVRIDQQLCSRCLVCISLCPFEAIIRGDDGRLEIDILRCQVCGVCYAACPSAAIRTAFYDTKALLDRALAACRGPSTDTLVLMCRGNSPSSGEVSGILSDRGIGEGRVSVRLPCAGRVPTEFLFKALASGVPRIVSIQCDERFCRMRQGSSIGSRRIALSRAVLGQLGYPEDAVQVVNYSRKAHWDGRECVGCDKCVFVCPYEAIRAQPFSSPALSIDDCMGCGACQMVCPHHAIEVRGYEFRPFMEAYLAAVGTMKLRNDRPAILVLCCQWSDYSALDDPAQPLRGMNSLMMEVPCAKGIDPVHVLNALDQGFDGVMVVVCPEADCKLPRGRDVSTRQLDVLRECLRKQGRQDRLELMELSPRCEERFGTRFAAFSKRLARMRDAAARGREG